MGYQYIKYIWKWRRCTKFGIENKNVSIVILSNQAMFGILVEQQNSGSMIEKFYFIVPVYGDNIDNGYIGELIRYKKGGNISSCDSTIVKISNRGG